MTYSAATRVVGLLLIYYLLFSREGRGVLFRSAPANRLIARVWRHPLAERLSRNLPPLYAQLTAIDRLNLLMLNGLRRILRRAPRLDIGVEGAESLAMLERGVRPAVVAMAHTGFPAIPHVVSCGTMQQNIYLLASDPEAQTHMFRRSGLSALDRVEIVRSDANCLAILARKLRSGGGIVLCAVDYRTSDSQSCNQVKPGMFNFAARLELDVHFAKFRSTPHGEFTVVLRNEASSQTASAMGEAFIRFSLPERVLQLD